jgi:hypothetical protein
MVLALLLSALPGVAPVSPVAAAEYTLVTASTYEVRPADGEIAVTVEITFTNTTPDPEGQFSVFPEILLALHDAAADVSATDAQGDLPVTVAVDDRGVNVAAIELREGVRYEETAELELRYVLADGADPQLRVRPSVVVFPAWSFGTAGTVAVALPGGYEVRVDGDPLSEEAGRLVSGEIGDPSHWLALVTATRPSDTAVFDATVPLSGGTVDLQVRSFSDDTAWGERTLDVVERALPLIEEEIGLPYPRVGTLVLVEAVPAVASAFAESTGSGDEILVAFDQPPFTALHQLAHVWLDAELVEARWIREGMASDVAARVAAELDLDLPYDPAAEATTRAGAAFALDAWSSSPDAAADAYGHAASWSLIGELRAMVGDEALQTTLARVASSIGPYEAGDPGAPAENGVPIEPLTSRSFLDQLETVTGARDLAPAFASRVFSEADSALLAPRAEARAAFDGLLAAAGSWGAPDPVRGAMEAWSFVDARGLISDALAWLEGRDELLAAMEAAGLAAPDRLQQAYRSFGGGAEAYDELGAERAVVEAYGAAAAEVNAPRSFLARAGLVGGPDPAQRLTVANGRFADGDLRGATEAIGEAQAIVASAETGGLIRILSLLLVVVILCAGAVILIRRRSSYTAGP